MFWVLALTTLTLITLAYFKWAFTYWKRRNVPQLSPSIPFGDAENLFQVKIGTAFKLKEFYDKFKAMGHKHGGIYYSLTPMYMPIDPEYIKNIIATDFVHFVDHGVYHNEKVDPISAHLFNIEGQKWKFVRSKVTATFTSGKMKFMFGTLLDSCGKLKDELDRICANHETFNVKDTLTRFSIDVIGSCAFGLECNSFKHPEAVFFKNSKKVFPSTLDARLRLFLSITFPSFCRLINMRLFSAELNRFFHDVVQEVMQHRETNNLTRSDFIQLLMALKNDTTDALNFDQLVAQAFVFFIAGFETTSTAMTFCLYELVQNQDIQEKLRREVACVVKKHGGQLTYEAIMDMKYLAQVIDETTRKYPIEKLHRMCTKDYPIPGTDVILKKGTKVLVSLIGLHYDPEYYPEPQVFDPDRFTEENKAKRPQFTHLPFGDGPRHCIGFRFALMEVKVVMAMLIQNYRLTMSAEVKQPMKLNPKTRLPSFKEPLLLSVHKINANELNNRQYS